MTRRRAVPGAGVAVLAWVLATGSALGLAGCAQLGSGGAPVEVGEDGLTATTPRALAAVVIEHVPTIDGGEPRRTRGGWSDWADPLRVEAEIDYGEDPEGTGEGAVRSLRVEAATIESFSQRDRRLLTTCPDANGGCEAEPVDGGTLVYLWYGGVPEEDPGNVGYRYVGEDQVVTLIFDGFDIYRDDPRDGDLPVDLDQLREAVLDPDLRLRTAPESVEAGEDLAGYTGEEEPPEEPQIRATRPQELADRVADYAGREPRDVRRSRLDLLGPGAVGASMTFPARRRYAAYTVDVLTVAGRPRLLDPMPCTRPRQGSPSDLEGCYGFTPSDAAVWTAGRDGRPGTFLFLTWQEDDVFNRVESVAIRVRTTDLDGNPYAFAGVDLPEEIYQLGNLGGDLSVGPERRRAGTR